MAMEIRNLIISSSLFKDAPLKWKTYLSPLGPYYVLNFAWPCWHATSASDRSDESRKQHHLQFKVPKQFSIGTFVPLLLQKNPETYEKNSGDFQQSSDFCGKKNNKINNEYSVRASTCMKTMARMWVHMYRHVSVGLSVTRMGSKAY